ncbi:MULTISPECIES: phosphomannomutase [Marinovum]|uniref:phosphomannomutase n=1 Tax=Marinovum TaxID=367771 RepID=UPI00237B874C|nr:phosphomannomutase [Marinovum sp. PR37]MDD9746391.1 phosphomannomutase [Marinovum sp. PR37]
MPPKFGTSGLRGLVTELTDALVADHTRAFLAACPHGGALYLGRDLRPSSPRIAAVVAATARAEGLEVVDCGALPTPALALASLAAGKAAVMVTGSHIPADRNGLKFYVPGGEISKRDEGGILAALGRAPGTHQGSYRESDAAAAYLQRSVAGFGPAALDGLRIGVYQHSSVARDLLIEVIEALGGAAVPLARSETFVPVDTEALDPETRAMLAGWCAEHHLDAVISTDGDADRPMLADATGAVVPGDVLGALTARSLGARVICTPVSSNSMVRQMPEFESVELTRIGSPFVIAAMETALDEDPTARVVGYEANGGFLLGFAAEGPAGPLAPLMTRDCLLPMLAPLAAARAEGRALADLVAALPARFTAADRITGIPTETSQAFLAQLSRDAGARAAFVDDVEAGVDLTDGLRVTFEGGDVVHLRPSGNAPEFRCYAEAGSAARARTLVSGYLEKLGKVLGAAEAPTA